MRICEKNGWQWCEDHMFASIQYERPICVGITRRAVVNPIQIGREYCIVLKVRMLTNYLGDMSILIIIFGIYTRCQ